MTMLASVFTWVHSWWWPESGEGYAYFSSVGGCAILGTSALSGFALWYRHVRCHDCHRIGTHRIEHNIGVDSAGHVERGDSVAAGHQVYHARYCRHHRTPALKAHHNRRGHSGKR
jgi:hypothetical protein